jgi:hypothetical protein
MADWFETKDDPPVFLPAWLESDYRDGKLTDITRTTDRFRVFVDEQGKVHDGSVYYTEFARDYE